MHGWQVKESLQQAGIEMPGAEVQEEIQGNRWGVWTVPPTCWRKFKKIAEPYHVGTVLSDDEPLSLAPDSNLYL